MFLTPAELRELTGRARPKAQIAALKRMRIRHKINELGRPVVTWGAVDSWCGPAGEPDPMLVRPDFSGVRG